MTFRFFPSLAARPADAGRRGSVRWSRAGLALAVTALALGAASCASDKVREGKGGSYAVIDAVEGASGATGCGEWSTAVSSDVITIVKKKGPDGDVYVPTVFEDCGRVKMHLALKDVGTPVNPTSPSANNLITFTRYRVVYRRADGRNQPGVDVPYPFDGAATFTVGTSPVTAAFSLVRIQAKQEAPLRALRVDLSGGAYAISTLAEITFFGTDQAGNEVTASGTIGVNFADWGDPDS